MTCTHRFAKFDDATIFCTRCGEQKVMDVQALIAKLPVPVYMPCPYPHPQPSWWRPTPWVTPYWYTGINTSGTAAYPSVVTFVTGDTRSLTSGGEPA